MASRLVPSRYSGMACPDRMTFGFAHGPNAVIGDMLVSGRVSTYPGFVINMQVQASTFVGFVVGVQVNQTSAANYVSTTVQVADWRDRLHDNHLYGAFNMEDQEGRFFHIFPFDWTVQRKTYINRELTPQDFDSIQNISIFSDQDQTLRTESFGELLSAATILNQIAISFNFIWTASDMALNILQKVKPDNLDWNGGVTVAQAVQDLVERCGCQFACYGYNKMHVTVKGYAENAFSYQIMNGFTSICNVNADSGNIGKSISERGRRIVILGDFNKYQYTFPCSFNWNPIWDWRLCYDGWTLAALLEALNLTLLDKLGSMPSQYHDLEKFDGKPRIEMTIKDYIEQICFRCYIVDFSHVVIDFFDDVPITNPDATVIAKFDKPNMNVFRDNDGNIEFDTFNWIINPFDDNYNSLFPVSKNLVSDQEVKFTPYATSRKLIKANANPFQNQKNFTAHHSGAKLEVEEVINRTNAKGEYKVRVFFNEPKFWLNDDLPADDPKAIIPDLVLVTLCLDGDIYRFVMGESGSGPRVREQKRTASSLYKAYINNNEQQVLYATFVEQLRDAGATPAVIPLLADDIAQRMAATALFHEAIQVSGSLDFYYIAGYLPDGIIDSVYVTLDAASRPSLTETVSFSNSIIETASGGLITPIKFKSKIKSEQEIMRDTLAEFTRQQTKQARVVGKVITLEDQVLNTQGGKSAPQSVNSFFGTGGLLVGLIEEQFFSTEPSVRGDVMLLNEPNKRSEEE